MQCCGRLLEAATWGCARWADSYLMPDDPASEALRASFGAKGGGGPHVVAVLLQVANTLLSQCATSLASSVACQRAFYSDLWGMRTMYNT